MTESLFKPKIIFFFSVIVVVTALLFTEYLLIISIALVIFLLVKIFNKNLIVFLIILSLLTLTSTISVSLRAAIQLISIFILFHLFLKTYGFEVSIYPRIPKEIGLLISAVLISMIISTLFSNYFILGVQQIIRLVVFLIIIYFLYSLTKENNDVRLLFYSLAVVGFIYSVIIFNELAKNNFSFIELNLSQLEQVSSEYINLNSFGSFFIIIISMTLSFLMGKKEENIRWSLGLLFIILLGGLIITNSRGAILAVLLSSVYILYVLNKRVLKRILISLVFVSPVFFIEQVAKFIDVYFRVERLTTGRDLIFDVAFNIIRNNPILGVGPAATKYSIYSNLNVMLGTPAEKFLAFHFNKIEFGHAHNFYLFYWSDLGILGLFSAILLPVLFFRLSHKAIKKTKDTNLDYYLITLGITAAGIGLFIRGLFEWGNLISYGTIGTDLPFWILIIILSYINMNQINCADKIFLRNKV
jgi:O-antigen ligase